MAAVDDQVSPAAAPFSSLSSSASASSAAWLRRPVAPNTVDDRVAAYCVHDVIGEGTYGMVRRAAWLGHPAAAAIRDAMREKREYLHFFDALPHEALAAIKRMRVESEMQSNGYAFLMREIATLQRIRAAQDQYAAALHRFGPSHPRVEALRGSQYCLRLLEVQERASHFPSIVTELCAASMHDLIYNSLQEEGRHPQRPLPLCCVATFTRQLLEALSFLHDGLRILHRDLKPANIFIQVVPRRRRSTAPPPDAGSQTPPLGGFTTPASVAGQHGNEDDRWTSVRSDLSSPDVARQGDFESPPHRDPASPASDPRLVRPTATASEPCCGGAVPPSEAEAASAPSPPVTPPTRSSTAAAPSAPAAPAAPAVAAAAASSLPSHAQSECEEGIYCRLCGSTPMPHDAHAAPSDAPLPEEFAQLIPRLLTEEVMLEIRVGDFGSSTQVGPQPITASHLRSARAPHRNAAEDDDDDDNFPLLPLGHFPPCFAASSVPLPDSRVLGEWHVSSAVRFGNTPLPEERYEYPEAMAALRRPRVTQGWTTLSYRSPEDILGDHRRAIDHNRKQTHGHLVRHGTSIDVWAAGCIFIEMLTSYTPFVQFDPKGQQHFPTLARMLTVLGCPVRDRAPECCESPEAHQYCTSTRCWPGMAHVLANRRAWLRPTRDTEGARDARDAFVVGGAFELFGACQGRGLGEVDHARANERCALLDRALFVHRYGVDIQLADARGVTPRSSPTADLIARLLLLDPSRRISASEALSHQVLSATLPPGAARR